MRKNQSGQAIIVVIIFILMAASVMMVGGFKKVETKTKGKPFTPTIEPPAVSKDQNLQLQTLKITRDKEFCPVDMIDPTSGRVVCADVASCTGCPPGEATIICNYDQCVDLNPDDPRGGSSPFGNAGCAAFAHFCQTCELEEGIICWGKPVIYLYPTAKTLVDVEVKTSGKIVISDPLYPIGGWKNVEAHPDGTLFYNGKKYKELFYESEVKNYGAPSTGIIIPISSIESELKRNLLQLGLNEEESGEFLEYWIPRLKDLGTPYILFSIVEENVKRITDRIIVTPEPDTRIEFLVYFKPLEFPEKIKPLVLPQRPKRVGFTLVEWGGGIDRGQSSINY